MIPTRLDLPDAFHQPIPCPRPIPTTASATGNPPKRGARQDARKSSLHTVCRPDKFA
ncbi:hypothetical protein [Kingella denitrificans]